MKVSIKANVDGALLEVTLYEGEPDAPDGDLETLLLRGARSVLAAHKAQETS